MDALDLSKAAEDVSPQLAVRKLMTGFWASRILHVAAELGIADLLTDGPKSSEELADSTGTHAPIAPSSAPRTGKFGCLR